MGASPARWCRRLGSCQNSPCRESRAWSHESLGPLEARWSQAVSRSAASPTEAGRTASHIALIEVLAILNDGGSLCARGSRCYSAFVYATLSPYSDTGSVEIDGEATGLTLDAYAPAILPSGSIEVSSGLELTKGEHRVRFTVIGTNTASLGHGFGLDCLELRP